MRLLRAWAGILVTIAVLPVFFVRLGASGAMGLYGIVEKVVFEPSEQNPQRIQVWGAFAYVEQGGASSTSHAARGYLYFTLPDSQLTAAAAPDAIRKEWADLKAVAGTGQAVAFGRWGFIASFSSLQPDARPTLPSTILVAAPGGGANADLRVRPPSEPVANPAPYQTNVGIVKLSEQGSHAEIVKMLRDALKH